MATQAKHGKIPIQVSTETQKMNQTQYGFQWKTWIMLTGSY